MSNVLGSQYKNFFSPGPLCAAVRRRNPRFACVSPTPHFRFRSSSFTSTQSVARRSLQIWLHHRSTQRSQKASGGEVKSGISRPVRDDVKQSGDNFGRSDPLQGLLISSMVMNYILALICHKRSDEMMLTKEPCFYLPRSVIWLLRSLALRYDFTDAIQNC